MAIQQVNVGAAPNDKTGDKLRDAFIKLNANDDDLDSRVSTAQGEAESASTAAAGALAVGEAAQSDATQALQNASNAQTTANDAQTVANAAVPKIDLADPTDPAKGAAMVGFDGATADAFLASARPFYDYAELRAYSGRSTGGRLTKDGIAGDFYVDPADATSTDNGGTIIVDGAARRWKRRFSGACQLAWFEPTADGVTSDSAVLQAAVNAAINHRTALELFPGKFAITSTITAADQNLTIYGHGATLIQTTTSRIFNFTGGWSNISPIASFPTTSSLVVGGADPFPDWKTGDVLKITSEQTLGIFPTNAKRGEYAVVYSVDAGTRTVTFMTPLRDTYDVNETARVGKLSDAKYIVDGVVFDIVRGRTTSSGWNVQDLIRITSANAPEVRNCRTLFSYDVQITLWGCYRGVVSNYRADGGYNDDDDDNTGFLAYGVRLSFSSFCKVQSSYFSRLRHGCVVISSDSSSIGTISPTLQTYGASVGNVFSNNVAAFCSNSAYDTHHGVVDTVFESCHSSFGRRGAFSNRGINTRAFGCTSTEDLYGVTNFVQSGYVGTDVSLPSMDWIGCVITNPRGAAFYTFRNSGNLSIIGGSVHVTKNTVSATGLYRFEGSVDVFITGGHQTHLNAFISTLPCVFSLDGNGNQRVHVDGWYIDCRGMGNPNTKAFFTNLQVGPGSPQLYVNNFNAFTTSTSSRFGYLASGNINTSSGIRSAMLTNFIGVHQTISNMDLGTRLYGPVSLGLSSAPIGNVFFS